MSEDFKFTWEIIHEEKVIASKEKDQSFDKFLDNTPFLFVVTNKQSKESFTFLVKHDEKPIFFRRVFGRCSLTTMFNKVIGIVNVFGVEGEDTKLMCEKDGRYMLIDNADKAIEVN